MQMFVGIRCPGGPLLRPPPHTPNQQAGAEYICALGFGPRLNRWGRGFERRKGGFTRRPRRGMVCSTVFPFLSVRAIFRWGQSTERASKWGVGSSTVRTLFLNREPWTGYPFSRFDQGPVVTAESALLTGCQDKESPVMKQMEIRRGA